MFYMGDLDVGAVRPFKVLIQSIAGVGLPAEIPSPQQIGLLRCPHIQMNLKSVPVREKQVRELGGDHSPCIRDSRAGRNILPAFGGEQSGIKRAGHIDSAVQRHCPLIHTAEVAAQFGFPERQQLRILLHGLLRDRFLGIEIRERN
ncbi:hypothetical protein D3C73_499570 [compost metagenome]